MKVTFYRTGYFYVTFNGHDEKMFKSLDEAINYISDNFTEGNTEIWKIIDLDTDEVIMTFEDEEIFSSLKDDIDETDFNPYTGCYDFDC